MHWFDDVVDSEHDEVQHPPLFYFSLVYRERPRKGGDGTMVHLQELLLEKSNQLWQREDRVLLS
jgi:hypothetical protein